ncbi:MAG: hypothetical protein Dasosvirus1_11 [Dasosvirus sp.]|uniref:Uncharacterized protein n=1 Tax=Dasosvirus sp. TaxID=2487764 RepID=A0A3G4ZR45_9VIRU|nr:MAG: hypothetical protein Dasosvirus1_11 [Dasosvirus sp.]
MTERETVENNRIRLRISAGPTTYAVKIDRIVTQMINNMRYDFTFNQIGKRKYQIKIIKYGSYKEENEKEIAIQLEKFHNHNQKLVEALTKTDENINKITKELYKKLGEEKDFDESYTKCTEELLTLLAGDIRVRNNSNKVLESIKEQKTIDVILAKSENITWIMEFGDYYYNQQLCMEFYLCSANNNIQEFSRKECESTSVVIPLQKNQFDTKDTMLCDVFVENIGSKFELKRMRKIKETDTSYIIDHPKSQIHAPETIDKNKNRVYPIKTNYKLSDFKINQPIFALWQKSIVGILRFYYAKITKINKENLTVVFNDGDTQDVELSEVWKCDDFPENFKGKVV